MSVLRVVRTPGYTTIPNKTLQDSRLSFRARGVLGFLLSHPADWVTRTSDLPDQGKEGRDATRTALAELREVGYVEQAREKYLSDNGKLLWRTVTLVKDDCDLVVPEPGEPSSEPELVSSNSEGASEPWESGALLQTPTHTSSTSHRTTSYSMTGVTARGPRKSRKEAALRSQAEEEALDPSKSLGLWDESPAEEEPDQDLQATDRERRRQEILQSRRTRSVGPAENLARYFGTLARSAAVSGPPGASNTKALSGQFAQWMRDGVSQAEIRSMIETYWGEGFRRPEDVVAWRDFLNRRGQILGQEQRESKVAEVEKNRFDENYWN